jgi:uncharacterized protein (DUF934 family)
MALVKGGRAVADSWTHLDDEADIPAEGPITVSWNRWHKHHDVLHRAPGMLGVRVANTVPVAEIGIAAANFSLIALSFPSFADGRAFSQARVLRDRYRYAGELRATGSVLRDQLQFMQRCGIDTFEVPDRAISEDWFAALTEIDLFYQPAADNRPWIVRQRQRSSPGA